MSHEPPVPASWQRRIDRLARSIDDVASAQHDLQAQIDQLVTIVARLGQPEQEASDPGPARPVGPPTTPGHRRWLRPVSRLARAGVRATLGVARRAWDTAHPDPPWTDQVLVEWGAPAASLPSIAVVVDAENADLDDSKRGGTSANATAKLSEAGNSANGTSPADAESGGTLAMRVSAQATRARSIQTDSTTLWWTWTRSTNRVEPIGPDSHRQAAVTFPADLECDYLWVITPTQLVSLISTTVEIARMALAHDRPDVLRLDSQAHGGTETDRHALIVRRPLWHPVAGIDQAALRARAALDETGVLGRDSGGISAHWIGGHPFRDAAGPILRRTGPWWVPARAEPRSYTHQIFPVSALPETDVDSDSISDRRPTVLIVLAAPLVAGCERQVADLFDAVGSDAQVILAGLVPNGSLASSRWRLLAARASHAYPLWAALPEQAHAAAVAALARRWRARDVLIFSANGWIDRQHDAWADGLEGQRVLHMPWDDRASQSRSVETVRPIEPIVMTSGGTDTSAGATLRASLGIASTAVVVGLMTDLVSTERPEDFVMVADRLRDDPRLAFLLSGNGPLAESIADLANLLPPSRLFWTRTGPDAETFIAACDVVCATAERRPTLAPLRLAAMSKRPIVATNVDATEPLLDDGPCGLLYEPGDLNALASALIVMKDPAVRAAYASAGPAAAARAQPGDPSVAWRAVLGLAPEAESRDR